MASDGMAPVRAREERATGVCVRPCVEEELAKEWAVRVERSAALLWCMSW